jgi:hypothetical protein
MPQVFEAACCAELTPVFPLAQNCYEECVRNLIDRLDPADFKTVSLFSKSDGLFPTAITRKFERAVGVRVFQDSALGPPPEYESWPEEHPLDFDWRFSKDTARNIAALAMESRRVLCIETPTVYFHLVRLSCDVVLIDRNPCLKVVFGASGNILTRDVEDLEDDALRPEFDAVILDPPWYLEHFLLWIEVASRYVRSGGALLLTRFPPLIRPTAAEEWRWIESHLSTFGPIEEHDIDIRYRTPMFEQATLTVNGLGEIPYWRSARLVSVRMVNRGTLHRQPRPPRDRWFRFRLGSQVVAVRAGGSMATDVGVGIAPVALNGNRFVLDTVSGRYQGRGRIDLWTSRNVAVQVVGRPTVIEFLTLLEAGYMPDAAAAAAGDALSKPVLLSLACSLGCEVD